MSLWNADLYMQFGSERTQPSLDLVARINIAQPQRIVDLGCGPGNSTHSLRQRWPEAEIVGLDNSAAMIEAASKEYPHQKWELADIGTWEADSPFDIVFSNAALQWLPDHARLYPHLFEQVAPGGAMAIQMPSHVKAPLHLVRERVSRLPQWDHLMEGPRNELSREAPSFYYDVLQPSGGAAGYLGDGVSARHGEPAGDFELVS